MSSKSPNTNRLSSSATRSLPQANALGDDRSSQTAEIDQDFEVESARDSDLEIEVETSKVKEFGDFILHEKLGDGASAVVFRATHKENSGSVALKIFRRADEYHYFEREKEVIERLAHPNIALHFGFGEHSSRRYVSMELVPGIDLESRLAQQGLFQIDEVLKIVFQVALALEHAHFRDLVHRDVKPSNIIVDEDGLARLLDLGVSRDIKFVEESDTESPAKLEATVGFTPPEIFFSHVVCPAGDLFSLGATAYFLLTGDFIVPGESIEKRIVNLKSGNFNELDALDLDQDIHAVFKKLLEFDLESRYQSAKDLISDLSGIMSERGISMPNRSVKILIVEDNEFDLMLTVRILEKTNPSVEVTRAGTFSEAIEAIQNSNFDLVLLDLNLPDSRGRETVTRFVQANSDNVPIIVLSGQEVSVNEFGDEVSGFLNKDRLDPTSLERSIFLAYAKNRAR